MKNFTFLTAAAVFIASFTLFSCAKDAGAAPQGEAVSTEVQNGVIIGKKSGGVAVFKGIPYASPPLNELRFAPPQDAQDWDGELDCTEFRSPASQRGASYTGSEDCLYLNVWAPDSVVGADAANAGEKLPVYVWIHGGAFSFGAGSEPTYDGTEFAKNGVVCVTINYRLNSLGFFASRETYKQYGTTGNWGLLDQIKALQWVQQNIMAFGGDPKRVTIGGESAGSYSVSGLILSPLASGLFRSVIMESGSVFALLQAGYYQHGNLDNSIEVSSIFANCFDAADDAAGLQKMREVDIDTIVGYGSAGLDLSAVLAFQFFPVFDGYVLPKEPYKALESGNYNHVNLLFGYNTDEGSLFMSSADKYSQKMIATKVLGYDNQEAVFEVFPLKEGEYLEQCRQIIMHGQFSAGMKKFGDVLSHDGLDVWGYHFAYVTDFGKKNGLGAFHSAEIEYAFGSKKAENQKLVSAVHGYWVNFIKTGNPNAESGGNAVIWEKYDSAGKKMIRFDKTISVEQMFDAEKNDFVLNLMEANAQADSM